MVRSGGRGKARAYHVCASAYRQRFARLFFFFSDFIYVGGLHYIRGGKTHVRSI
jgi:hypothetical protein